MRHMILALALTLCGVSIAFAQGVHDQASDRAYILKAESDMAESVVTHDTSASERLMADDFLGIWIDGSQYSKSDHYARANPSSYVSNHTNEVVIRFYGNTAIAQGSESWKKKDGTRGFWVWTDTWIQREGKWQIIASEDLVPPPEYKPHERPQ